jgi:hypothetical protein
MVPMRQEEPATRAWREARLGTVTLYAKADPTRPREVTVHEDGGEPSLERVGLERPRLASFVVATMPAAGGPKGPARARLAARRGTRVLPGRVSFRHLRRGE